MKYSNLTRIHDTSSLKKNQIITLEDDRFHYIKTVLRMKMGEIFRVFNDQDGEYYAELIEIGRSRVILQVGDLFRIPTLDKQLSLAMCIIKPDRMIEAVKAAVQLGVTEIIPVISERTQTKSINIEKFNKIIVLASEQCERFTVPIMREPLLLASLLNSSNEQQLIFANEEEQNFLVKDIKLWQKNITLLIGPEGGFTKNEKEQIEKKNNVVSIGLGSLVLRSEIAVISALACISLLRD